MVRVRAGTGAWASASRRQAGGRKGPHFLMNMSVSLSENDPTPPTASGGGACLLKLQLGPVQDFIAQARSTRDLWAGSYLLSWLMAHAVQALDRPGVEMIYPVWVGQPLREVLKTEAEWLKQTVANLPNVLLAKLTVEDPGKLAKAAEQAIREEWARIADCVWQFCAHNHLQPFGNRARYDRQIAQFPSVAWQISWEDPQGEELWGHRVGRNSAELAAVRRTRPFEGWGSERSAGGENNKDSLTGREEAVVGGKAWGKTLPNEFKNFFKSDDWVGALTLVKRLWHRAYLVEKRKFPKEAFKMPNTLGVADHDPFAEVPSHDMDGHPFPELEQGADEDGRDGTKYFAVLALDGDQMGAHLRSLAGAGGHTKFSGDLSAFALTQVAQIVAEFDGRHIYAGGDDVLALLPADTALDCARKLRWQFQKAMGGTLDASVGLALGHYTTPLQDMVRAAQDAEKRAKRVPEKGGEGRQAFALTLFNRSGETVEWGGKWDGGAIDLYDAVNEKMQQGVLSARFPHRMIELLQPYLSAPTPLIADHAPLETKDFKARAVIEAEFDYCLARQKGPNSPRQEAAKVALRDEMNKLLAQYIDQFADRSQETLIRSLKGLFQTVAFVRRTGKKEAAR